MSMSIQFQPDVQSRYDAWIHDPRNVPAINAAQQAAPFVEKLYGSYTAALKAGIITPQDFDNAVDNREKLAVGPNGTVGPHQGIPLAAKALAAIPIALGGGEILGALGGVGAPAAAATEGAGAAGVLPSTTIGSGFLGPITGGTGLTALSGGGAAGLTGGRILSALGDVGPVLSSAATGAEHNNLTQDQLSLGRDRLAQDQYQANVTNPGTRLRSAYKASMISNQTPTTHTGGPGGVGPVKFSGGFSNPAIAATVKPEADDVVAQQLQEQLLRGSDMPKPTPPSGGAGGDLLGGASLAANILGAFGARGTNNKRILDAMNGGTA